MKPHRIQRKRTKGWRMPENTVYVGRPTEWGNPYPTVEEFERAIDNGDIFEHLAAKYPATQDIPNYWNLENWLESLRGMNLACWCPLDKSCHADILLELANATDGKAGKNL